MDLTSRHGENVPRRLPADGLFLRQTDTDGVDGHGMPRPRFNVHPAKTMTHELEHEQLANYECRDELFSADTRIMRTLPLTRILLYKFPSFSAAPQVGSAPMPRQFPKAKAP